MYCYLEFSNRRAIALQHTNGSASTFGSFKNAASKFLKIHGNDQTNFLMPDILEERFSQIRIGIYKVQG